MAAADNNDVPGFHVVDSRCNSNQADQARLHKRGSVQSRGRVQMFHVKHPLALLLANTKLAENPIQNIFNVDATREAF